MANFCFGEVIGLAKRLSIRILFTNLLKPMYGDYSWSGRIISFFVRIIQFIILLIFLLIWIALMVIIFLLYLVLPLGIAYNIIYQIWGIELGLNLYQFL